MNTILIIALVSVLLVTLTQVMRILEITSAMRGESNSVNDTDNRNQGFLMVLFMIAMLGSFIWSYFAWSHHLLPEPASEHGAKIDRLMAITMGVIIFVFFVTQILLFWFAFKYRGAKNRKAAYISHNNKLEMVWTFIPAVVLTVLIAYGLNTWTGMMSSDMTDARVVEFYARQFDWTARIAGEDNVLGEANVRYIEGQNIVGVNPEDEAGFDDQMIRGEIHIPVGQPHLLKFRSQDVIHSAYFPHFRMQMNCVPGMITQFAFTPTKTTAEMREITGNPEFEYVLLCNKICGAAHYNMQMTIVVESEADYQAWLAEQSTMKQG
jgi:cytochrome c oxidase subunit 2